MPDELREIDQWVVWRSEERENRERTKVPYSPRTGRRASVTRRSDWGSFEDAASCLQGGGADGIGFVFTADDPFVGIDFDHVRNPYSGAIELSVEEIVRTLDSYTEMSPSGEGLHVIVRAKLPGPGRKKSWIEMYDRGRFFTVTGNVPKL